MRPRAGRSQIRAAVPIACLLAVASGGARASASDAVIDDGRDPFTLFYRHPVNRQLFTQLSAPDQDFRLGRDLGRVAFAADLSFGTEQTFGLTPQARFHGYYLADTYLAAHLLDGLDANLNLLLLNSSASDGYRVSSQVDAGLALHAWLNVLTLRDAPVRFDVYGTDLGWVTLGAGLMVEQVPLEGVTGRLSYRQLALAYSYIGRAFWSDDDLIRYQASMFGDRIGLMLLNWIKTDVQVAGAPPTPNAIFVSAFADFPLPRGFHVAGEVAARARENPQWAALGRADYLGRPVSWLEAHLGYQFRWYGRRFGPRDVVIQPSVPFSTPQQEDVYVTNSFEYFGISSLFAQWSHTVMLETRARIGTHVQLFAQGELWSRAASSPAPDVAFTPEGFAAPGTRTELFYRGGASVYPWAGRVHRANFYMTNKQVNGGPMVNDLVYQRFAVRGPYVVLELQAFM